MNARQYHREMNSIITSLDGRRPRLLLHSCCAPCSTTCLEVLVPHFDVTLFFCNPNILPEAEYEKRLYWLRQLLERAPFARGVELLVPARDEESFRRAVAGLEREKEGGARCPVCFRLRLEKTAQQAKEGGFDYFTTTLTVSRHKNARLINTIGEELARETGTVWLPSDFKKQGGCDRSTLLADEYGLYRQLWCGCGWPEERV